jgi:hypothetical protein
MVINRLSVGGYGDPNGTINGYKGSLYTDLSAGNLYIKQSIPGTLTGWVLLTTGSAASLQQIYYTPTAAPTDATKPAIRFPAGGGTIEEWNGSAWV